MSEWLGEESESVGDPPEASKYFTVKLYCVTKISY